MKTIKTRSKAKGIKVLDRPANLTGRMKDAFVRTKERAEETHDPRHASPAEYAADNVQSTAQGAVWEIARNPLNPRQKAREHWNNAKGQFREVKRQLPKERRAAAEQASRAAVKARDNAYKLRNAADKAGRTAKDAKTAVKEAKQTLKQVRLQGRCTLREAKQKARTDSGIATKAEAPNVPANAGAGGIPRARSGATPRTAPESVSKPENPAKRAFIKNRARTQAENTRLSRKLAVKPDDLTVNPVRGAASPGRPINAHGSGIPVNSSSRPRSVSVRIRPAQQSANAVKSTGKGFKDTAKGTIKAAKKSVKSAEKSAKAAVKTARQTAKSAAKTAKTSAKATKTAERAARAAAKAAAHTAKATGKAVAAMLKAAIAVAKGLAAVIAAGGSIAALIVLIVCMIGLMTGSVFGIFFSGQPSADGGKTINSVIAEINDEYTAQIGGVISGSAHDLLDMSGARASWKEVLAVYTVKTTGDPESPMEVATVDDIKAALLRTVFWEMNAISHSIDTADVEEDVLDADGLPTGDTAAIAKTVLRISVTHKTPAEMAAGYGFTAAQTAQLDELLEPERYALWNSLLYGVTSIGDGSMIEIADTQIGNIGGQPYWSWYGFTSRVDWCACFVSWCADRLGYIDSGALPLFSACEDGIRWFKERGRWRDGGYTPNPGDIIFFDWEGDGVSDHVGIVERVEGEIARTIEGNTSDSVARRSYALNSVKITGYGIPVYNAP
ncbi:MAG: CHAP domain-containing protein [Gracilibacteraceae bacterium]|jgi:hypothetical protein|nr:CHAP domain-containing protein [Gracilibacteraceae bacterium]